MSIPSDAKVNYVLLLVMNVLYTGLCGMWITYFPLYASERLGLSSRVLGLLYTSSSLTLVIGKLVGGFLADTIGKRICIVIGYLAALLSLAAMMLPSAALACVGFVAYFLGIGALSPAVAAMILESSPRRAQGTLYMLASRVAPSIPPLVTLPIAGYLYEEGMYRATILVGMLTIAALMSIAMLLREPTSSKSGRTLIESVKWLGNLVLRDRLFILLVLAFGLDMLIIEGLEWYIPIYLRKLGFTAIEYGLTMGLASLAVSIGALASGSMVDRLGPRLASAIGWCLAAIASLLFVFTPTLSLAMLFLWRVIGLLPRAVPPIVIARRYGDSKAMALSAFDVSMMLISMAGPALVGITASISPSLPFILRAVTLALSTTIILATVPELEKY